MDLQQNEIIASLKDSKGRFSITNEYVEWEPFADDLDSSAGTAPSKNAIKIPIERIKVLHINPPSEEKVLIKITPYDDNLPDLDKNGYLFNFVGNINAVKLRDSIKEFLTKQLAIIKLASSTADNKKQASSPTQQSISTNNVPGSIGSSSQTCYPQSNVIVSNEEIKTRGLLLAKDKNLLNLHRSLVMTGKISEDDFWNLHKDLIKNFQISFNQTKGVSHVSMHTDASGKLPFPSALSKVEESPGPIKFTLTPAIIQSIFIQNSVVHQAYQLMVPFKMSEKEFWTNYFTSKYFNSSSGLAAKGNDNIFDELIRDSSVNLSGNNIDTLMAEDEEADFESDQGISHEEFPLKAENQITNKERQSELVRKLNVQSVNILKSTVKLKRRDEARHFGKVNTISNQLTFLPEQVFIGREVICNKRDLPVDAAQNTNNEFNESGSTENYLAVQEQDWNSSFSSFFPTTGTAINKIELNNNSLTLPDELRNYLLLVCEVLRHFWSSFPPSVSLLQSNNEFSPSHTFKAAFANVSNAEKHDKILRLLPLLQSYHKEHLIPKFKSIHLALERAIKCGEMIMSLPVYKD